MTKGEFERSLQNLKRYGEIYEPRPGRIEARYGRRVYTSEGELKPKGKQVKIKMEKQKIYKSKAKLIKRKYVEGYQCADCGKWFKRPWADRRLTTCPKCGARETVKAAAFDRESVRLETQLEMLDRNIQFRSKSIADIKNQLNQYQHDADKQNIRVFERKLKKATGALDVVAQKRASVQGRLEKLEGKRVLKRAYKKYQRTTKHYRALLKYVEPSRVGMPGITVAKWPAPPPKPTAGTIIEKKKPKHRKRVEYRGSTDASEAGKRSWETRKKRGWKPKAETKKPQTLQIKGKVRLSQMEIAGYKSWASRRGRVLVGFFKDEDGKVKPLTKSVREVKRERIVKKPRKFQPVKPNRKPWKLPARVTRLKHQPSIDAKQKKRVRAK
jgi:DNA-directed RNA polymerase subunit RPC12/RpoP